MSHIILFLLVIFSLNINAARIHIVKAEYKLTSIWPCAFEATDVANDLIKKCATIETNNLGNQVNMPQNCSVAVSDFAVSKEDIYSSLLVGHMLVEFYCIPDTTGTSPTEEGHTSGAAAGPTTRVTTTVANSTTDQQFIPTRNIVAANHGEPLNIFCAGGSNKVESPIYLACCRKNKQEISSSVIGWILAVTTKLATSYLYANCCERG